MTQTQAAAAAATNSSTSGNIGILALCFPSHHQFTSTAHFTINPSIHTTNYNNNKYLFQFGPEPDSAQ